MDSQDIGIQESQDALFDLNRHDIGDSVPDELMHVAIRYEPTASITADLDDRLRCIGYIWEWPRRC